MADANDSSLAFFTKGTPKQWKFVHELRKDAIRVKSDQRSSKKGGPEEFIKLDTWFREKLPQAIHSRKEPHVRYEELVQIAKWRLMMCKYRPKMLDLVRINTELSVTNTTRKAFKKLAQTKNLAQAIQALVNLKGIGPSTASAILVSAYPEMAPFMSDEGMLSTPGVEATDSTIAEYNNYSEQLCKKAKFLQEKDPEYKWTPHKVDQVLWIHYLVHEFKPSLLEGMPVENKRGHVVDEDEEEEEDEEAQVDSSEGNASHIPLEPDDNAMMGANEAASSTSDNAILNGNGLMNGNGSYDDNSYPSVPYSDEASADASSSIVTGSNSNSLQLPDSALCSQSLTQKHNTSLLTNGHHSNGNGIVSTSSLGSNGNGSEEDSKDCIDSEDSRGALSLQITPDNSNGGLLDHDHDSQDLDQPPMKKQKTLELSSALQAATAAPGEAEA